MSHIPMEIDTNQGYDWIKSQLMTTRNVTSSIFNDWFTGHLNYQIEHQLVYFVFKTLMLKIKVLYNH